MDNEAIVDQIVRSLSFEVVAVPQNVIQVDSTSKSTPLNVKIRVRKKHGADLRHGVLSMPKVDTKSNNRKNEMPERVRLVSSDQTIMNFNVLMEADFDNRHHKKNLNLISPGLEVNIEENPNLCKNANEIHTEQIFSKKHKDIFGKCKPGGCLDPPFDEDKYTYQPTQHNLPLPVKNDAAKLRSSSIFKNNIFKRKRKSSQADDELNKCDINNKNEIDTINLSKKGFLETSAPYSNSIITYPDPSDSGEFHKQEEKAINREEELSYRKRYSSSDRSKTSSIEDGSYFMIPKKTKNLSNQSDLNKIQHNYIKPDENNIEIIKQRDETNLENVPAIPEKTEDKKIEKSKFISQPHTFIPIPIVVPLNATVNSTITKNEILDINSDVENSIQASNSTTQKISEINSQVEIITTHKQNYLFVDRKSVTLQESETLKNSDSYAENEEKKVKTENQIETLRSIKPQESSASSLAKNRKRLSDIASNREQDSINELKNTNSISLINSQIQNDKLDITKHLISAQEEKFDEFNIDGVNDNIHTVENQTNTKSHPLLPEAREKSFLDITTDFTAKVRANSKQDQRYSRNLSTSNESYQNTPFGSQDIDHIWENENDILKSMADVITTKPNNDMNINSLEKMQQRTLSENVNEEYSISQKNVERPAGDNYDELQGDIKQQEQTDRSIFHDTVSQLDSQSNNVTPPSTHSTKNNSEDMTREEFLIDSNKNLAGYTKDEVRSDHFGDVKPPEIVNSIKQGNVIQNENDTQNFGSITHINENRKDETQAGTFEKLEKVLVENIENLNSAETFHIIEQNTNEINENESAISKKIYDSENTEDHIDKNDESLDKKNNLAIRNNNIETQNNNLEHSGDFSVDKVKDMNKIVLKDTSFTSITEDDSTVRDLFPYKRNQIVSDQLENHIDSENLPYEASNTSDKQDDKHLEKYPSKEFAEKNKSKNRQEELLDDTIFKQTAENSETKIQLEDKNNNSEMNFGLDKIPSNSPSEILHKASSASHPPSILRTGEISCKMDIALQSYVDENNEKVIKSFDSKKIPERRLNDAFLVAQCYLGNESNEIKIPIDQDNELSVKIVNTKHQHVPLVGFNDNDNPSESEKNKIELTVSDKSQATINKTSNLSNTINEARNSNNEHEKKKIKIDVPVSGSVVEEYTNYEELNKAEANRYKKAIMNGDIRNALNSIYEEELVPLQSIIKGVREEIDALVAYQMKLNMQNLPPKRSKPLRLVVHPYKKCCCFRRL